MITESVDGNPSNFGIFSGCVIALDKRLRFVANGFLERSLTGYGRTTSSFSAASSGFAIASITCFYSAKLSGAFTFG
jgi:hypothetical protein